MSLFQRINKELKIALKSGDSFKVQTLRLLSSVFHNREIEKKGKNEDASLSDEEIIDLLGKEAKKRRESAEIYEKGGRIDLANKERKELEIIMSYMPEQLSEAEIENTIHKILEKYPIASPKDFGKVMGEAMKDLKGRADASLVGRILKKKAGME